MPTAATSRLALSTNAPPSEPTNIPSSPNWIGAPAVVSSRATLDCARHAVDADRRYVQVGVEHERAAFGANEHTEQSELDWRAGRRQLARHPGLCAPRCRCRPPLRPGWR